MLKHTLIHPEINAVLGRAGHGATVLIADGNYPASTTLGPHGSQINLNLSPGLLACPQVLEALVTAIPIERVNTKTCGQASEHLGKDPMGEAAK